MNKYVHWLNLDFDPFEPGAPSRDFYRSSHRQNLLDQIVEFSLYSNAMIAVTGPVGAGKTTLAKHFCDRFADEAVCIKVDAALFMNQNQFLETIQGVLGFKLVDSSSTNSSIDQICRYAAELDLEARSLILIIDDAHELSAEALQMLTKLLESCVDSSIHALLFGGNPLDSALQSILTDDAQERLAIFPLDGFASDETLEYIRFKLATARFTKELPIDVGIIDVIHNSSRGIPGAINNLVADALNSAAPACESDELAGIGPTLGRNSIEQVDDYERIGVLEAYDSDEIGDREQAWVAGIQPRYWAPATVVVLLTGALLFGDTSPGDRQLIPIAVAVTPGATQVVEVERLADMAVVVPLLTSADQAVVAELEGFQVTGAAAQDQSNSIDVAIVEEVVAAEAVAAVNNDVEVAETIVEVAVEEQTAVITIASSFVERLLQASPGTYAVQLLASYSKASIIEFIVQLGGDHPASYFETRYQNKPWFVAVLAPSDDRDEATGIISSLPAILRSNEPWVRSVAGIQTDIRKLLDSKLVSVK